MREKIEFFEKWLGVTKVVEILEDYVLKAYPKSELNAVGAKKRGRPMGSIKTSSTKRKIFPNGMHYWTEEEEKQLIDHEKDLRQSGLKGKELARELGRKFGVSYRAAYARLMLSKQKYQDQLVRN
jgi:transposase